MNGRMRLRFHGSMIPRPRPGCRKSVPSATQRMIACHESSDAAWRGALGSAAVCTAGRFGRASQASLPRASSRDAMTRRSSISWPVWSRPAHCRLEPYAMPIMQPSVAKRRNERTSSLSIASRLPRAEEEQRNRVATWRASDVPRPRTRLRVRRRGTPRPTSSQTASSCGRDSRPRLQYAEGRPRPAPVAVPRRHKPF